MFLIHCEKDDSDVILEDEFVIYDEESGVRKGDNVTFFYQKKQFEGTIIMISGKQIRISHSRVKINTPYTIGLLEKMHSLFYDHNITYLVHHFR